MANTIISQYGVSDGYTAQVSRDGKLPEFVFFRTQPANVQAAVDAWAVGVAAREAAEAAAEAARDDWEIVEA